MQVFGKRILKTIFLVFGHENHFYEVLGVFTVLGVFLLFGRSCCFQASFK